MSLRYSKECLTNLNTSTNVYAFTQRTRHNLTAILLKPRDLLNCLYKGRTSHCRSEQFSMKNGQNYDIFRRMRCARRIMSACVTPARSCPFFLRNSLLACANAFDCFLSVFVFLLVLLPLVCIRPSKFDRLNCPDLRIWSRPDRRRTTMLRSIIMSGLLITSARVSSITISGSLTMRRRACSWAAFRISRSKSSRICCSCCSCSCC